MSRKSDVRLGLALSILGGALLLSFGLSRALAGDDVSEEQIIRALAPSQKTVTRGLSDAAAAAPAVGEDEKFIQGIRGRTTRSLSLGEREEIATIAKDKPNIDLEINFDYDSASISAKSLPAVQALGRALTSAELKGSTFIVAGHTDAAGSEAYNQDLSERRAETIKHYLTRTYGMSGLDLVTVGYGKSKLKDPSQPLSGVNRRVQVVNMADKAAASK